MAQRPSARIVVAAAQLAGCTDIERNLTAIETMVKDASKSQARLIVFPEAVMYDYHAAGETIAQIAAKSGEHFEIELCRIAREHRVTIVAGGYGAKSNQRSYNFLIVAGPDGRIVARYNKLHLYDAFNVLESEKHDVAPLKPNCGELVVFEVDGVRFGLANCYDLRFPEMFRLLIDRGADCLVVASGWVSGPLKESHWKTLLKARAIENTCFVVGSCQPAPQSVGLSMIIDPMGVAIAGVPECEGLAIAEVNLERQVNVRKVLPSLTQRRYRVVQGKS